MIKKILKGCAFGVLLPLQSIKDHVRTIEIGCHKQRAMCLYAYSHALIGFAGNMFPPTNKQAASISTNMKRISIIMTTNTCMQSREIQCTGNGKGHTATASQQPQGKHSNHANKLATTAKRDFGSRVKRGILDPISLYWLLGCDCVCMCVCVRVCASVFVFICVFVISVCLCVAGAGGIRAKLMMSKSCIGWIQRLGRYKKSNCIYLNGQKK